MKTIVPVKVECECGQHYAFDVEPINGFMPYTVNCPTCGADGTARANEIIASQLASAPSSPPPFTPAPAASEDSPLFIEPKQTSVHLATTPPPMRPRPATSTTLLGSETRESVETEARAKIMWGDTPEDVTKFLMMKGVPVHEAKALTETFFKDRAAATRGNGIRKIITGFGMMCVPVIAFVIMKAIGIIFIKLLGIAGAVGLYGAWQFLDGIIKVVAPKMEHGDVADQ